MTVQAVFFDLGGTLFRYGDLRERLGGLLVELLQRHDVSAEPETIRNAYHQAMGRQFLEFGSRPFYLHRDLFEAAHRDFLAAFDIVPKPEDTSPFLYDGQRQLGFDAVQPRACASEALRWLRGRDLHLGIVSNIDDDQFQPLWERMGLAEFFDATTTSEEARSCKPHAGIYEHALAKAGDPQPEQVIFVGDSPDHDIAGANALGMTTVLIIDRDETPQRGPQADHVIRELTELIGILEE